MVMQKRISKSDALKAIRDTDALEVIYDEIERRDSASTKQSALNRFVSEVQKQIKDERNVKLIAIKVK